MSLLITSLAAAAPEALPAGGSPIKQLIIATLFAGGMTTAVLLVAYLHRSGRTQLLTKIGDWVGEVEGLPGWAAIPTAIGFGSLALAFLGVYWDISLHLDNGRDPGPLANLAHYPILIGLQGLFLAGVLAMVMPKKGAYVGPSAVRVAPGWRVPTASLSLMACAVLGYTGFPLDDVWHRLFGQDVTLWGPTHLMMISGAVLSIIALALLQVEGERAYGPTKNRAQKLRRRGMRLTVPMALLIAISLYLGEWDWGVQQYLMVWQPLVMAAGAGFALVFARRWSGRGGAILAALGYTGARLLVNAIVGYGFGQTMPTLPLFFAEALVVEAVFAFALMRHRTVLPVVVAGLGIGTIGFAAQYGWSQIAMPTPWTTELLGNGVPMAIVGGIAGSMIGLLFALALRGDLAIVPNRRVYGSLAAVTLLALGGIAGNQDYSSGGTITTTISGTHQIRPSVGTGPEDGAIREGTVTVRFQDPAQAKGAHFVSTVAWQGGGLVSDRMDRIADGVYRTDKAIPLGGSWKTIIRVQQGRRLLAVPVDMPADPGIPVGAHVNPGTETLQLHTEQQLMQRERKPDVPATLWMPAIVGVLGMMALFAIGLGFATARVGLRTKREPSTVDASSAAGAGGKTRVPATKPAAPHVAYSPSDR
jgi:hypothetical protein